MTWDRKDKRSDLLKEVMSYMPRENEYRIVLGG
jgi:hypothetical protein